MRFRRDVNAAAAEHADSSVMLVTTASGHAVAISASGGLPSTGSMILVILAKLHYRSPSAELLPVTHGVKVDAVLSESQ